MRLNALDSGVRQNDEFSKPRSMVHLFLLNVNGAVILRGARF
jgi:hypothetical protein